MLKQISWSLFRWKVACRQLKMHKDGKLDAEGAAVKQYPRRRLNETVIQDTVNSGTVLSSRRGERDKNPRVDM